MIPLKNNPNVDNSDPGNYPDGRVKDNTGSGNGTPVNRSVYGDLHSNISKLMRLYGIIPNELPDNETNGFQLIQALSALASKNDYIYPLTTNGTDTLSVDIKLALMNDGEFLVCLASTNKTTETLIKGSTGSSFAITYSGNFKANEYVRVIKTSGGVSIVRIADWNSLDAMASDLLYLKKASQAQENAGAIDTVATTPLVNKVTYALRTIGADSGSYLATNARNGLYPKEHFVIVSGLNTIVPKNVGWFSGVNIDSGSVGATYARSGHIVSATITANASGRQVIRCVMANAMADSNYEVDTTIESQGSFANDVEIQREVFKPINETTFDIAIRESAAVTQSLKFHCKVYQLS